MMHECNKAIGNSINFLTTFFILFLPSKIIEIIFLYMFFLLKGGVLNSPFSFITDL